jgi:predicted nucleic acid-binding Zn ribbon protein
MIKEDATMSEDRCVCCGDIIPEGQQVCWQCEHEETQHHCIVCSKEIPKPELVFGGRKNGKTMTMLCYNIRQMCCSDQCAQEFIEKLGEEIDGN